MLGLLRDTSTSLEDCHDICLTFVTIPYLGIVKFVIMNRASYTETIRTYQIKLLPEYLERMGRGPF